MTATARAGRVGTLAGAAALAGLSALHFAWAAGSSFPARDRVRLAEVAAGRSEVPSTPACLVVGTGLGVAAGLVAGAGGDRRLARWGRWAVAAAFFGRSAAGLSGATRLLVPWTPQPEFVRLDRRYYSPLCWGIAVAAARAATASTIRSTASAKLAGSSSAGKCGLSEAAVG